ncbi:LysR family transcriptional regulator [Zhongshania sp.]|jgi:DNA-binding transcriptional LysR family regulator|uniref:LysR family transcriptional regulator n=1 Tax=Zhongshania sp. TaxID=1971902 RepID=UPI002A81EA86|nr:LysR family transcriptional regulator [Zhongshania sp.]
MVRRFPEVSLGSIELFCLCAESESFSAAAQRANISPPAVSRAIARLELRLGVKLFGRTTRKIKLTEAGRRYYDQCQQAIGQIIEVEREITGQQQTPSGLVRLSIPTPFGHYALLPKLAEFHAKYPDIILQIHMGNRNIDFIADGFDLAVRMRPPSEGELVARTLIRARQVVVGSPQYLKKTGTPRCLADLAEHNCIQFLPPSSGTVAPWSFVSEGKAFDIPVSGRLSVMDDPLGGVALASSHCGLLQTYSFAVERELRDGRLLEVLQEYAGPPRQISLVYRKSPYIPLRMRVLIDFLVESFCGV